MLSQNFIPTRTPQATELVAGTHELVAELQERLAPESLSTIRN